MAKWSLETRDRKEAQRKWPAALERWERQVAEWSNPGQATSPPVAMTEPPPSPPPRGPAKVTPARAAAGPTITKLYDRWAAVAAVKPRTATEAKYHVDDLKRCLGHDDAARVTVEDIRKWRDDLKARGLNNNTVNARLGAVKQVFLRAESDGLIGANPAEAKLRLPKQKAAPRYPYSQEDAQRILEASRSEPRASRRWAHWLMAFSGARVGEVLQLMGRDVRQEGSIWFMEISPEDATATVKNDQKRRVPLHPALIAEGFVTFAQTIAPDAPIFADKGLGKHGKRGERAWQVVGRWVREVVGITDKAKAPNHSWRHYFEDALRDAEVESDVRDAIIGHAQKTTGRLYGVKGEALARLARAVEKVPSPLKRPGRPCGTAESTGAADIGMILRTFMQERVEGDRPGVPPNWQYPLHELERMLAVATRGLSSRNVDRVRHDADRLTAEYGLPKQAWNKLAVGLLEAEVALLQQAIRRAQGKEATLSPG
jgi:integrase